MKKINIIGLGIYIGLFTSYVSYTAAEKAAFDIQQEESQKELQKQLNNQLLEAAKKHDAYQAHTLIKQKASVDFQDADGNSALFFAIKPIWQQDMYDGILSPNSNLSLIKILIKAGASPHQKNNNQITIHETLLLGQKMHLIVPISQDIPNPCFLPDYYHKVTEIVTRLHHQKQHVDTIQYAHQEPLPYVIAHLIMKYAEIIKCTKR